jgi:hypothetical protein
MGGLASQVVRSLALLNIAEHLESGPLTAEMIAQRASANPRMTLRLLRAATALGLVEYQPSKGTFASTPGLEFLSEDSAETLKHFAIHVGNPAVYQPASRLVHAVTDGDTQSVAALGAGHFEYLADHPDAAATFSAAMTDVSEPLIRAAVPLIDVGQAQYAVDVGGAEGVFVAQLTESNPNLRGGVFDLPHVVGKLHDVGAQRGVEDRIDTIAGDFFDSVPEADIYLLKFILHDWDDAACIRLLTNIRRAMKANGRVIVLELVVDEARPDVFTTLLDMVMMSAMGGQERTADEYDVLFSAAGLQRSEQVDVRDGYKLLVATPE